MSTNRVKDPVWTHAMRWDFARQRFACRCGVVYQDADGSFMGENRSRDLHRAHKAQVARAIVASGGVPG